MQATSPLTYRYQTLVDLYQPKIIEFKQKVESLTVQINAIEQPLDQANQNIKVQKDKVMNRIALAILSGLAAVFLTIASIAMPALLLLPIIPASVAAVCLISARELKKVSFKNTLNEEEREQLASLRTAKRCLKLLINQGEERLKGANDALSPECLRSMKDSKRTEYINSVEKYYSKLESNYQNWVARADATARGKALVIS